MELAMEVPRLIPRSLDLLQGPKGDIHPLLLEGNMNLLAWKISGVLQDTLDFQERLKAFWMSLGLREQGEDISVLGIDGVVGAWNGIWIPWRLL